MLTPSPKVGEVKKVLESEHKVGDSALQKLILRGKTTTDDQTMETLGVKDGDFIVLMISKVNSFFLNTIMSIVDQSFQKPATTATTTTTSTDVKPENKPTER